MRNKWLYFIGPILIMGIIFLFSSQPYHEQDLRPSLNEYIPLDFAKEYLEGIEFPYRGGVISVETHGAAGFIEFFIRKGAHFVIYFALMLVTYLSIAKVWGWSFWKRWGLSFELTVAYAGFDEYHQSLTPNRTPYIGDVFLDAAGAPCAGLIIWGVHQRRNHQ
ncbi:VanZ family protein [Halobacillus litoralis]|uniref:VanZ family protein n=1 Tax=Halobacillus litoralis TaxID=45668 RepID=UPI001CD47DC5|nr:VanZ family protein [Halobacillus litoralis]MCA0971536.1 VanZ family protein [Halobacillus litoralis]